MDKLLSGYPDSNRGPLTPHASALPGCAIPRYDIIYHYFIEMLGQYNKGNTNFNLMLFILRTHLMRVTFIGNVCSSMLKYERTIYHARAF